jgi:hypothetical protein
MKTVRSPKQTSLRRRLGSSPPLRTLLNATRAEAEAAARRLGFDVSRKDWLERLKSESGSYPYTRDEGECYAALMPAPILARLRALELIEDILDQIAEIEYDASDFDEEVAELRARLADNPIPVPVAVYIKQVDRKVA